MVAYDPAMQMGYDFDDGRQAASPTSRNAAFGKPWRQHGEAAEMPLAECNPDWLGLKARFLAIHALRRTLCLETDSTLPVGSFIAAGEAVLAACRIEGRAVNPVYSANGKETGSINGFVAASSPLGDRGIQ